MKPDYDPPPVDPDELGWGEEIEAGYDNQPQTNDDEHEQTERKWFQPEARPCAFHEDGEFATDYGVYAECDVCGLADQCRQQHDKQAKANRAGLHGFPHYLTVPIGLLTDRDLKPLEYLVISLIHYRCQKFDFCTDSNTTIGKIFGVTRARISQLLGNKSTSLVSRGYIVAGRQKLPRKKETPLYRSSRTLTPGVRSLRLINQYRLSKDGLSKC